MKKYGILMIGLILSVMVFGQNETRMMGISEVEVTPPGFTGVEKSTTLLEKNNAAKLMNYIKANIDYPENEIVAKIEGTEVIQFTVTPQREVTDIIVINSVSPAVDKELIRILKTTNGMWNPGHKNGEVTSMEQQITVMIGNNEDGKIASRFINEATFYFKKGSKSLVLKNNPKKALRFYSQAVRYLPNEPNLLLMRGMCYYEIGETEKAKEDWNKVASHEDFDIKGINNDLTGMNGYIEMTNIIAKK